VEYYYDRLYRWAQIYHPPPFSRGMAYAILAEMFSRRGLKAALITAIVYALLLIPFKQFVIIESVTEVRPANIVPVIAGILLGPGAALGSAFGNLVGDMFGTLTWASIAGFIGNFAFAFVAWLVWTKVRMQDSERFDLRAIGRYLAAAIAGSVVCAAIAALGFELTGLGGFVEIFITISVNNLSWTCSLGLIMVWALYGRIKENDSATAGKCAPL